MSRYRDGIEAQADYRIKKGNKEAARRIADLNAKRREIEARGATAFAHCPTHGLHGERNHCYVCLGDVELVAMVPEAVQAERDAVALELDRLREGVRCYLLSEYGPNWNEVVRVCEADAAAATLADFLPEMHA